MRHYQKLILFILISSIGFSEGSFRGKTKEQLIGQPIPLAFVNMVANEYNILPSQINPQRGSYLIIAPDGVMNYLPDFVSFKQSQGFDVHVVALSEAGSNAEDIKTTITQKLEEDPMLEYVLLIGDVDGFAAFPSFYYGPENDVTDQKFTHILGDDNIPDVFIGRLSIDSISDMAVIMYKTMQYIRDPLAFNQDWLSRGLVVAGNYSNTYPIPITPKWTSYWLREELLDFGYSQVDTVFYPPTQQGAPYIVPLIDNGVGIVNYRGWGDANGWHYPEFHVDDVNDLNNGWLTPVFMSYVCNSNDFANSVDPCLAEAILRGGTPTVPKGGVAFVGPSDLHTSTKYNNVINAYMYDAMLNHGVVELGPAMQAGQSGLIKEFPAQNGPGEAQEFYAHVYNILGDPSLQVYTNTPDQFTLDIESFDSHDGLIDMTVFNSNGQPVNQAVISIMNNDEMITKGISDENGKFVTTLDPSDISYSINVYANKGGFIQGHEEVLKTESTQNYVLASVTYLCENGGDNPTLAEGVYLTLSLKNQSQNALGATTGEITFNGVTSPESFSMDIPAMAAGEIVELSPIEFSIYSTDVFEGSVASLTDANGESIFDFVIDVEQPTFGITFVNESLPSETIDPILNINNFSNTIFNDVWIDISPISEGSDVTLINSSTLLSNFDAFASANHQTNYNITLDDVAYGSDITFLIKMQKNGITFYEQEVPMHIEPAASNHPVAPNNYGYWAYDDLDIGYSATPTFNWIELDPNFGGSNGTHYQLDDDDHVDISLPFDFKYHGIDYSEITISSNGWTSFVPCNIDYFWNMSIPMYMGPKAMLAPFSDDLETIDTNGDDEIDVWINVYTLHDETNGRFIIEWSRALNGYDEVTEETFEIILYNQNAMPTESGDGVIDFQYLNVEDVDVTKNYSTVGIEAPEKNYGLQYVFNNVYASGAAPLENERVIRFTTEAPNNYVAPLSVDQISYPDGFSLSPAYPNPFNPTTHFDISIINTQNVSVNIYDILGRKITNLQQGIMVPGHYQLSWEGTSQNGTMVASGTYFAVMKCGDKTQIQKLLLLK